MDPMLTQEEQALLRRQSDSRMTDDHFAIFIHAINRFRLDPFAGQIHAVLRKARAGSQEMKITVQTGIDGFRLIADRTEQYAGNDDAAFDSETKPRKATVAVYKLVGGQRCPFAASARWDEYYPGDKLGTFWKKMPCVMLAKCAEALALRKAFPAELSGLYTDDEMRQADGAPDDSPPPGNRDAPTISENARKWIDDFAKHTRLAFCWEKLYPQAVKQFTTEPDRSAVLTALSAKATEIVLKQIADTPPESRQGVREAALKCADMFLPEDTYRMQAAFLGDDAGRLEDNPNEFLVLLKEHKAALKSCTSETARHAGTNSRAERAAAEVTRRMEYVAFIVDLDALEADITSCEVVFDSEDLRQIRKGNEAMRQEFTKDSQVGGE